MEEENRGVSGSTERSNGTIPHVTCRDCAKHFAHVYPGPELSLSSTRWVRIFLVLQRQELRLMRSNGSPRWPWSRAGIQPRSGVSRICFCDIHGDLATTGYILHIRFI